jgi:hypothetical protein
MTATEGGTTMAHYVVLGPERQLRPMRWDPPEPPEYGRDVAFVANAPNANAAKWAAARLWEKFDGIFSLPRENRGDGKHPLAGVTVERFDEPDSPSGWGRYYADLGA